MNIKTKCLIFKSESLKAKMIQN